MSDLRLPDVDVVAVDVEASGLHPDEGARLSCVGLAWEGGSLALPFDQGVLDKRPGWQMELGEQNSPNLGNREWSQLLLWLEGRSLVFHNAKYDLTILQAGTREWTGLDLAAGTIWDTMVVEHALEPTKLIALRDIAKRLGLQPKGEEEVKTWLRQARAGKDYSLVPWEIMSEYVKHDAELCWQVYKHQTARVAAGDAEPARIDREMQLMRVLFAMEQRGVGFDGEASARAAEWLQSEVDRLVELLPFDGTPAGAQDFFFDQLGLQAARTTAAGRRSMDAEQVDRWVAEGVQHADTWSKVTRYRSAISKWYAAYPGFLGPDGRLRGMFRQCKVRSGRMSIERVQLQALPTDRYNIDGVPGVRELVVPAKGKQLWSLDLSQAELRVAARYSECEKMLRMLENGTDLHAYTCERVLGATPGQEGWKGLRGIAKRLNFASIFQVGAGTFAATVSKETGERMTRARAHDLVQGWRSEYPEFSRASRRAELEVKRAGYVYLLSGTPYETPSWFGPRDEAHKGWSRKVQGSLAEFFKLWMIEIEREWPGLMILSVHDSVLLEVKGRQAERTVDEVLAVGREMASGLFDVEMPVDKERWK